jgi:hypothetical protein
MVSVIGEIPKDARDPALREILTSLKPGAYLLVAECLDDPDYQRTKAVRALLTGCGFEIDSTQKATFGYRVKASRPNSAAHVAQATSAEPTIAR